MPSCSSIKGWHLRPAHRPAQHHADPIAGKVPGVESAGKRLAVHARHRLSNGIFKSYDQIVDHCCDAWNKLIDQPRKIMSIGLRKWAHES
jgi:hypothetical protein